MQKILSAYLALSSPKSGLVFSFTNQQCPITQLTDPHNNKYKWCGNVGSMPIYTPLCKTSSLMFQSIRAMFFAPFTHLRSRPDHLHNGTLSHSFHSQAPRVPFDTLGASTRHLSTFNSKATVIYSLFSNKFYVGYLVCMYRSSSTTSFTPSVVGFLWPLQVYIQKWHQHPSSSHSYILYSYPHTFITRVPTGGSATPSLASIMVLPSTRLLPHMSRPTYFFP